MDLESRVRAAFEGIYAVEREVGRGGSAVVFLATDLRHPRKVAIKVLHPDVASAVGPDRFRREIAIEASLTHPNILPLHDSGEADGLLYFVMPAVEGQSLAEVLKRRGPMPPQEAARVASEVAAALAYAHRRGVVHRDIKPGNILLEDGHAVVADFGIARLLDAEDRGTTAVGRLVGTPSYMSPEQLGSGAAIDGRADVYALGCVLYEMLTGDVLFHGRSPEAVIARHLSGSTTQVLGEADDVIPLDLAAVIRRCVARDPAERFATADEVVRALSGGAVGTGVTAPASRRWKALAAMALMVAVVLGLWGIRTGFGGAPDARKSYLVQAHRLASMSSVEAEIALEAAGALTRFLTGWREVTAVPEVAQASVGLSVGLAGAIRTDLEESIRLARAYPVGTLVAVTAHIAGDSASVEAVRFDVRTKQQVGDPIGSSGPTNDVYGLVMPIALEILEVAGAPPNLLLQRESSVIGAIQDLRAGQLLLEQWDLPGARARLLAALAQDSTLGRAHYYLALTDYWHVARDWILGGKLGPSIVQEAVAAVRHSERMTFRDSVHAEAFAALALGDFEGARSRYDGLVRSDTTDSYAWLLLGATEHSDPVAVEVPPGRLVPRGDPNRAANAFLEAVRLSPQFALGFGFLFDQYRGLASDARRCEYRGFRLPSAAELPAEGELDPARFTYRCAVALDSIRWLTSGEMEREDGNAVTLGAERYRERALAHLERLRQLNPTSPRAFEELALWRIEERRRLPPERWSAADSLGEAALASWREALSLRSDTTPEDLERLAGLTLAAGRHAEALPLARSALELASARGVAPADRPSSLANPLLAAGRLEEAIAVAVATPRRFFTQDVPGRFVPWNVDAEVAALRAFGALGVNDARSRDAFEAIEERWAQAHTRDEIATLRIAVLPRVALALMGDRERAEAWLAEAADSSGIWSALLAQDPVGAAAWVEARASWPPPETLIRAQRYLLGVVLERAGRPERALAYFEAARAEPPEIVAFDPAWGLQTMATLGEARCLEAMGDPGGSRTRLLDVEAVWREADASLAPSLAAVRAALSRLSSPEPT